MRCVGTVVRGIRTPVIKEDTDLAKTVVDSLMNAKENEGFNFKDRDIIAITEAVVGISEGNYVTVDDIKEDLLRKFPGKEIGIVYPILSRNRFSMILKAMARAMDKITIFLSFPADEVGNGIMNEADLEASPFNLSSVISYADYQEYFGKFIHPFTGINMVNFYKELCESENCQVDFVFSNNPKDILKYTNNVINCDIHTRIKTHDMLKEMGANVYGLYEIMNEPINGSGFNPKYGLLGSNKSTEERLKLFPKKGDELVKKIHDMMYELTGKNIEVMIYGDGGFKDPVGGIWEFADPVVSPFYTKGLKGTPNELKIKYLADNNFGDLNGDALKEAIVKEIEKKDGNLVGKMASEGTTPRQLTDLIGSLSDLTSGSGDKGTPVIFIQGYFDNYSTK